MTTMKEDAAAIKATLDISGQFNLPTKLVQFVSRRRKDFSLADVRYLRKLGRGNCGQSQIFHCKLGDADFVMKKRSKETLEMDPILCELAESEVAILRSLPCHPLVVTLIGTAESSDHMYLLMEHMPGGHVCIRGGLKPDAARFYLAEVCEALSFLHQRNIVHRDVKPENVLTAANGHVKLGGFGLAIMLNPGERDETRFIGTKGRMAPEVVTGPDHDSACDWWSYGVMAMEMTAGGNDSLTAKDLISKLLKVDPVARLDADGVRQHPFFEGIAWEKVRKLKLTPPPTREKLLSPQEEDFVPEEDESFSYYYYYSSWIRKDFSEQD